MKTAGALLLAALLTLSAQAQRGRSNRPTPTPAPADQQPVPDEVKVTLTETDILVLGGTPGGIMAAVNAARGGKKVVLLERTAHVGGLPANGLGATDIATRGATGGLFLEFVERVRRYYVETYGEDSQQVKDCSGGYHFEPHVAEQIFESFLNEHPDRLTVLTRRRFDADPKNVTLASGALNEIRALNLETGGMERYRARVFIDATYEGDLAAAAGAPYRLGREAASEFDEPMAGKLYKAWGGEVGPGSTGLGDNAVQAYNFRLCLTDVKENQLPIEKPEHYNRDEYLSLIGDVRDKRTAGRPGGEMAFDGIGKLVNMVRLPNGKTDANNQHLAFISTDLPEENWPWPTASWAWRDAFAQRLRDYTLGLIWFAQHDSGLPADFRERCLEWGLARDEYQDNGGFPRQAYVREGRRIEGEYLFTAHDAIPVEEGGRPPIHADSITASHYSLDSHAVLKREPGRVHLDGFFSYPAKPYTVPYGVMVPKNVDNLLTPVPASATHIGFSTLRMEPCWMALGQAAGAAAVMAVNGGISPRKIGVDLLQEALIAQGAVLIYFEDAKPGDDHYKALQYFALRGFFPMNEWNAELGKPVSGVRANQWLLWTKAPQSIHYLPGVTTRGELLTALYHYVQLLPEYDRGKIRGDWN
ncbi:MAG: FAD-dependent oxidoreductase [bacterium]|nr:FAD-dependent oxidoreductase [bacterium]